MNSTIAIRTTAGYKVYKQKRPKELPNQLGPGQDCVGRLLCELEDAETFDPRGEVVNGGGRGETRAIESLLGDALNDGVADGRL